MEKLLKDTVRIMAVIVAFTVLFTVPAMAKKDKKGGTYPPPTITAEQALSTVKAALPQVSVGKSIVKTGKRGDKKLDVTLVYGGQIVSRVKINPATGEIMPKGMKTSAYTVSASQEQAVNIVKSSLPEFEVGSVRLGKHGEWVVDLTLRKVAVASIAVHGGNGTIMPDWKASRDASQ